jgi:hypothetical protein
MSDMLMAPQTGHLLTAAYVDGMDEISMAREACLFGDRSCVRLQLDDIGKVSTRKGHRMEYSVVRLGSIFRQQAMGSVAIVTHRSLTVAGFGPTIIFGAHDMAVETRTRIVGQIRRSPRIDKRIDAQANGRSDRDSKEP